MEINGLFGSGATVGDSQKMGEHANLGQQEFLQLLVAQMKNQDPINPLEGAEFAAQLAQFNSVEQLIQVNDGLSKLSENQEMMSAGLNNSLSASLAGREIRAMSEQVWLEPSGDADIRFELANAATEVDVVVRSGSGAELRRTSLGSLPAGVHDWTWDGLNDGGARLGEGTYQISIEAANGEESIQATPFLEGIVERVRFGDQGVTLRVGQLDLPISDVMEIGESNQ
ncbi:MAG: flagellar hook capping FlgD N-terminal domain-containing protein [Balneolaceae bacterium]